LRHGPGGVPRRIRLRGPEGDSPETLN
jgi:hypothetical protein